MKIARTLASIGAACVLAVGIIGASAPASQATGKADSTVTVASVVVAPPGTPASAPAANALTAWAQFFPKPPDMPNSPKKQYVYCHADGFQPRENVRISIMGERSTSGIKLIKSGADRATGSVGATFQILPDFRPGEYKCVFTGKLSGTVSAPFVVVKAEKDGCARRA